MAEQQYSPTGDLVYTYKNYTPKKLTPAIGNGGNIEAVSRHIETNIGEIECVFHEVASHIVHIDVYWVKPTEKFPFHTLVTSGMSDKPMRTPEGMDDYQYTELCILLPQNWIIEGNSYGLMEEAFNDENNYWPIRWLKHIALFPHEYETWLGNGHTIPNGKEAAPFSSNNSFGCMVLLPSLSLGPNFFTLRSNPEKTIRFYCLYPLFKEEMDYKLKKGLNALIDRFEKHGVYDVVDIQRKNTCAKKSILGWW